MKIQQEVVTAAPAATQPTSSLHHATTRKTVATARPWSRISIDQHSRRDRDYRREGRSENICAIAASRADSCLLRDLSAAGIDIYYTAVFQTPRVRPSPDRTYVVDESIPNDFYAYLTQKGYKFVKPSFRCVVNRPKRAKTAQHAWHTRDRVVWATAAAATQNRETMRVKKRRHTPPVSGKCYSDESGCAYELLQSSFSQVCSQVLHAGYCDAEADEGYYSPGMSAVGGDEGCGCGVGGELCAGGGEDVGDEAVVAVVAEGVGGDVADGGFGEVGWERRSRVG